MMNRISTTPLVAAVMILSSLARANELDDTRMLFDFDEEDAAEAWQTVNDGVMGGRSTGRFDIKDDDTMVFRGTLSLENNGGFSSIRSRDSNLDLQAGESIVIRVRGDGRRYSLNLYNRTQRTAFSYRAEFSSVEEEWTVVRLPLNEFVATSYGRVLKNEMLMPSQITGVGFLIADKQAGPFELEIDWIKVAPAADNESNRCP